MPRRLNQRRVCFVTGTRAEFGLMVSTLRAIQNHPLLKLQIVATGMHLDPRHGDGIEQIESQGWKIDEIAPWPAGSSADENAVHTGAAMASCAEIFQRLQSEIVLIVGDRVEAFAAAAAAQVSGRVVAHVHGGDRALGQVDDSTRHAITKLAHAHFPATAESAARIEKLGEDRWRIFRCGSPGVDGIIESARPLPPHLSKKRFALVALHPTDVNEAVEQRRAAMVLQAVRSNGIPSIVVIGPNNDPGSVGISRYWKSVRETVEFHANLPRGDFLGLLRDAAFLIGNSSSGIIEAASFGTPVIDVGNRQRGRQRGGNVLNVPFRQGDLSHAIKSIWHSGRPKVLRTINIYGRNGAGKRIAGALAKLPWDERLRRKLIAY